MQDVIQKIINNKASLISVITTTGLGFGVALVMTYAFANLLHPQNLGLYQYIISATSIIGALYLTGINTALVRAVGKKDFSFVAQVRKLSLYGALLPFFGALVFFIYYALQGNLLIGTSVFVSTIFLLAGFYYSRFNSICVGLGEIVRSNYILKSITFSPIIFVLPTLFFTQNPGILVALFFFGSFFATLATCLFLKLRETERKIINSATQDPTTNTKYSKFAFHQSINTLIGTAGVHSDKIIIFQILGAQETAIYYIAVSLPNRIRSVINQFEPLLVTKLLRIDPKHIQTKMLERIIITILLAIPMVLVYVFFAPYFYSYLFPNYTDSVILTQIYSLIFIATAIGSLPQSAMRAHGSSMSFYTHTFGYSIFKIASITAGSYYFGLHGAVIANLLTAWVSSLLFLILYKNDVLKGTTN